MSNKVFFSILFLIVTTYCCCMYTSIANRVKDKKLELRVASLEKTQSEILVRLSEFETTATNRIGTMTIVK